MFRTNNIKNIGVIGKKDAIFKYNYNKSNWDKLKKCVNKIYNQKVYEENNLVANNRNLTNEEIDEKIKELENIILSAVDKTVPKYKTINITKNYRTPLIDKLQKTKSAFLSKTKRRPLSINEVFR